MKKIRSTTGRFWFGNAVVLTSVLLGLVGAGRAWAADGDDLALPQNKDGTYTLLTNINDDDGDGVPDYADLQNPMERNIRKIELYIEDISTPDNSSDGVCWWRPTDVVFSASNTSFTVPAAELWNGKKVGNRGYLDFQPLRSNGHVRIWTKDPTKARSPKDIFTKVATNWSEWPWEASFSITNFGPLTFKDDRHWVELGDIGSNGEFYLWTPRYAPTPLSRLWLGGVPWKQEHIDNYCQLEDFGLTNKWGKITLWLEGLEPGQVDLTCRAYGFSCLSEDSWDWPWCYHYGTSLSCREWRLFSNAPDNDHIRWSSSRYFTCDIPSCYFSTAARNNAATARNNYMPNSLPFWDAHPVDYKQVPNGVLLWETNYSIRVAEANLGINNNENMDDTDGLRVGVPDVTWKINDNDEALEDQKDGMPFWTDLTDGSTYKLSGLIDCMPLLVRDEQDLRNLGYRFYLRVQGGGSVLVHPYSHWQAQGSDLLLYLKSDANAKAQLKVQKAKEKRVAAEDVRIPINFKENRFLVRSCDRGSRTLELLVQAPGSDELQVTDSVKIDFKTPRQIISVMNARDSGTMPYAYPLDDGRTQTISAFKPAVRVDGSHDGIDTARKNYQVFIHGYSLNFSDGVVQAWTTYCCMYWTGFRGNFIGYCWPGDRGGALLDKNNFDIPVRDALRSAPAFMQLIRNTILNGYGIAPNRLNVMAHSLGNLVSVEALRLLQYESPGHVFMRTFISVEPAVHESMFWPVQDLNVRYRPSPWNTERAKTVTIDNLKRTSKAFWANQPGHEAFRSAGTWINSWNANDYALKTFTLNDLKGRMWEYENPLMKGFENDEWPSDYRVTYCENCAACAGGIIDFVKRAFPLPMPGSRVTLNTANSDLALDNDYEIAQGRKPMPSGGTYAQAINVSAKDYGWHPDSHSGFSLGDGSVAGVELGGEADASLGVVWRWYEQIHRTGGYVIGEE